MTTLVKEKPVVETPVEWDEDVYNRAAIELGYHGAHETSLQQQFDQECVGILNKANVEIYSDESVEKYKDRIVNRSGDNIAHHTSLTLGIIGALVALFLPVALFGLSWGSAILTAVAVFTGFLIPVLATIGVAHALNAKTREWRSVGLSSYSEAVPEFALETAMDVKRACEDTGIVPSFGIEYVVNYPDPFLYVTFNKNGKNFKKYLEVWNEPSFSKKREEV